MSADDPRRAPKRRGSVPGAGLGKRLEAALLLVEDNAPLRQMLSWELSDLGYQVRAAGGCAEARQLIERQSVRFALIDIRLPDGDGRELRAELAHRVPGLEIVLMSGAHDLQPDPGLAAACSRLSEKAGQSAPDSPTVGATGAHPRQCVNNGSRVP